jgi:hypothetical protein
VYTRSVGCQDQQADFFRSLASLLSELHGDIASDSREGFANVAELALNSRLRLYTQFRSHPVVLSLKHLCDGIRDSVTRFEGRRRITRMLLLVLFDEDCPDDVKEDYLPDLSRFERADRVHGRSFEADGRPSGRAVAR